MDMAQMLVVWSVFKNAVSVITTNLNFLVNPFWYACLMKW